MAIFGGVGAGVVALIVILVIVLSSGSKGSNSPGSSSGSDSGQAWSKASLGADIVGTWVAANDIIVGTTNGLTAYGAASGTQAWSRPLPSGDTMCSMSQSTSSPFGAFVYGRGQACASLEVVNLYTGELLWSSPMSLTDSTGEGAYGNATVPSIQGSHLTAPYGPSSVVDVDLTTGRAVWNTGQSAAMQNNEVECVTDNAVVLGAEIYTSEADCSGGRSQVWKYSATSATPPTVMNLPNGCAEPWLLPAGGSLLMVCNEGQSNAALFLLAPGSSAFTALKVMHFDSVALAGDSGGVGTQATLNGIAVSGSTLYVPDWANDMIAIQDVTGIDLGSGRTLWTTPMASSDYPQLLGATSAGALLRYSMTGGTYGIATVAASTGTLSKGRAFDGAALSGADTDVLVGDHVIGITDKPSSKGNQLVGVSLG